MSLGDLLFLLGLVLTVGTLLRGTYLLIRRRAAQVGRLLRRWAACALAYAIVLVAVSLAQPQRSIPLGASQCFDEWCLVVDHAARRREIGPTSAIGDFIVVTARVENHGRGRPQRETDVYTELRDDQGERFLVSPRGQQALEQETGIRTILRDTVSAGRAITVPLVFDVPHSSQRFVLIVRHDWFPHALIIGDPESLMHRPVVVPLAAAAG